MAESPRKVADRSRRAVRRVSPERRSVALAAITLIAQVPAKSRRHSRSVAFGCLVARLFAHRLDDDVSGDAAVGMRRAVAVLQPNSSRAKSAPASRRRPRVPWHGEASSCERVSGSPEMDAVPFLAIFVEVRSSLRIAWPVSLLARVRPRRLKFKLPYRPMYQVSATSAGYCCPSHHLTITSGTRRAVRRLPHLVLIGNAALRSPAHS